MSEQENVNGHNTNKTANQKSQKPTYEVVFFVRYHTIPRPSPEELETYFSKYGDVHHVNCPENKNFAFIFMTRLNTTEEYCRTRTTIEQIKKDMVPESRFYITVASSNRSPTARRASSEPNYPRAIRYSVPKYSGTSQFNRTRERAIFVRTGTFRPELLTFVRNTGNGKIRRPDNQQR